jgi:cell division protein ZapA (FtsZ GTPase activity inhibitor)
MELMSEISEKKAYEIVVLGNTINVKTSLSPDEIRQLVIILEEQVSEIKKSNSNLPPQKLYLLGMMAMAEKYLGLKSQVDHFKSEISSEVGHLKEYVEQFIQSPTTSSQATLPGTKSTP